MQAYSTWNRSVAWAAKTEKMCEKLRKYMCFPMKLLNKTVQKPCEIFAKSLNEGSAANAVENPRSAMFFTCANFREKVLLQNALYFTNIINYS